MGLIQANGRIWASPLSIERSQATCSPPPTPRARAWFRTLKAQASHMVRGPCAERRPARPTTTPIGANFRRQIRRSARWRRPRSMGRLIAHRAGSGAATRRFQGRSTASAALGASWNCTAATHMGAPRSPAGAIKPMRPSMSAFRRRNSRLCRLVWRDRSSCRRQAPPSLDRPIRFSLRLFLRRPVNHLCQAQVAISAEHRTRLRDRGGVAQFAARMV